MTISYSVGLKTGIANAFAAAFANGVLEIRSGTKPTTPDGSTAGTTLLALITLNGEPFIPGSPANGLTFSAAVAGKVNKSGFWSGMPLTDGYATWYRLRANAPDDGSASTTLVRFDGAIDTLASSGDPTRLVMGDRNVVTDKAIAIDKFSWEPFTLV